MNANNIAYTTIANEYMNGNFTCNINGETWKCVFEHIIQNMHEYTIDKSALHLLWTENGGVLRNKVRDDALIAAVLKLTLPGYNGSGLILYRGECRFLYEENKIGFCWTPDALVAERFASVLNCDESGGVLLRAFVKPNSILAAPNAHSAAFMEEFEYTCNPESIHGIELIKEFYKPSI